MWPTCATLFALVIKLSGEVLLNVLLLCFLFYWPIVGSLWWNNKCQINKSCDGNSTEIKLFLRHCLLSLPCVRLEGIRVVVCVHLSHVLREGAISLPCLTHLWLYAWGPLCLWWFTISEKLFYWLLFVIRPFIADASQKGPLISNCFGCILFLLRSKRHFQQSTRLTARPLLWQATF